MPVKGESIKEFSLRALIVLCVMAIYAQSVSFDFSYDDGPRIQRDQLVSGEPAGGTGLARIFSAPTFPGDLYRPVTTWTFRLNYLLFGLDPSFFHAFNVALHAAVSVLVFELLLVVCCSASIALCGALIFGLHPIQVEAVANISGRAELLAAFFGLLSLLVFVRGAKSWFGGILAAVLLLAACLSKESAAVFVFLIPLVSWFVAQMQRVRVWRGAIMLALGAALSVFLRYLVLGSVFSVTRAPYYLAENPLASEGVSFLTRLLVGLQLLGRYLILLVYPVDLSADYSLGPQHFWEAVYGSQGMLWLSVLTVWCVLAVKLRRSPAGLFAFWYLGAFLVTCNILTPIGTIMADRLAYLPSIGFIGLTVWGVPRILPGKRVLKTALAALAILLAVFLSLGRIPVWKDNTSLFLQTSLDAPFSPKAMESAGKEWFYTFKNYERAEFFFRRALALDPNRPETMPFLIDLSLARNNLKEAEYW
ncbi:MAG: hypothetical protein DCC75_06560, partial [Proteobacteria bacterium]